MVPKSYFRRFEFSCSDVPVVDPYSLPSLRQLSKPRLPVTLFTTPSASFLHTMAKLKWSALSVSLRSCIASPNSTVARAASSSHSSASSYQLRNTHLKCLHSRLSPEKSEGFSNNLGSVQLADCRCHRCHSSNAWAHNPVNINSYKLAQLVHF